jgi:hypothetical protein
MQQQIKNFEVGTEENHIVANLKDLGIAGVPKMFFLAERGLVTQAQRLELVQQIEQYCTENQGDYSLIARGIMEAEFVKYTSQIWNIENRIQYYLFTANTFKALHNQIPEKLENIPINLVLDYFAEIFEGTIESAQNSLKSLQVRWEKSSSIAYVQMLEGRVVSAATIHQDLNQRYTIAMLGTIAPKQNQAYTTDLYSYLVSQILEHNSEYTEVIEPDNLLMLEIFQKLGGIPKDSQTTWSWSG